MRNLRKARLKAGLTQKELAEMANLPRQTYQCYEYGTRTPSEEKIRKIEDALNIINHSYIVKRENLKLNFYLVVLTYILLVGLIVFMFCGD